MAAYRDRVYGARVIVTSLYGSLQAKSLWCKENCNEFVRQFTGTVYGSGVTVTNFVAAYTDRVYGARVIVTSLYGSIHGQSLWCNGNCNEFVWQLTRTEFMLQG